MSLQGAQESPLEALGSYKERKHAVGLARQLDVNPGGFTFDVSVPTSNTAGLIGTNYQLIQPVQGAVSYTSANLGLAGGT